MDRDTRIHAINKVLKEYFEDKPNQGPIPAKEFMELFVEKGIFNQDSNGGWPIRKLLRELDSENRLSDIPYAIGEMKRDDRLAGLVVDELMGQMEIVIKSMGKYVGKCKFISGATILGDGEVALILDANALI